MNDTPCMINVDTLTVEELYEMYFFGIRITVNDGYITGLLKED